MSQGFEINNSNNITPVTIEINEGLISEVIMWLGIACDRRTTISNNIIVQRGRVDGDNNMRTIINTHNFTTYFINRYGYNHFIDEYISRVVGLVEEFNRFLDIEVQNIQQTDENGVTS
jgi:hypothetical protein